MDVALYLLNQKRQEIAHLEEEYNLTLYLAGNPGARQNEYSLEFIKRDIVPDMVPVPERILLKEIEEPVRPVTSMAAYRGGTWEEQEEQEVSLPQPAVVVAIGMQEESEPDVIVVEESASVLAVARGRVFWRLTAPSRQTAVASALGNQPRPTSGARPGRHSAGRPTRRSRGGWWRRRTSAGAQTDAAHRPETPKAGENLGQVQGSSLA
jgi:hypothetical protein